jgi:large subunit ribosomal protein L10
MPNKSKFEKVKDLTDKLGRAKSIVLTDYRGLTVAKMEELRSKVEDDGAEYEVTKNTLLSLSLKDTSRETPIEVLVGPTAILFAFQDEIAPLKTLQDFIKINSLPIIKTGFLGNELISTSQVENLARLPSREVLLGKLVGSLKSTQFGLVNVLSGNIRKLVYALDAVAKTKVIN